MARKADSYLEKKPAQHGKKPNQKVKPYVVLQYLLKYTDENHVATALDICAYLEECGIFAERRSIYTCNAVSSGWSLSYLRAFEQTERHPYPYLR